MGIMCLTGAVGWSFVGATAAVVAELRGDLGMEIATDCGGYGDDYWRWGGDTSCA
jgi:hypothetical protein